MKSSLIRELYKFRHQKTPIYGILTLILLMFYGKLTSKNNQSLLMFGFGSTQWIPIILIAIGSAFFAMEYSNNTILILLYKSPSRYKVYISKLLVIFFFGILLTLVATFSTFVFKVTLVGSKYSWQSNFNGRGPLIKLLMLNMTGTIIYSFFIISLSFMLIMLVRINAAVIGIGLTLGFFGAGISVAMMKSFSGLIGILKWNPLNMIFVTQQLSNSSYEQVSGLNTLQIVIANILYGFIFAYLGYVLFKKKQI